MDKTIEDLTKEVGQKVDVFNQAVSNVKKEFEQYKNESSDQFEKISHLFKTNKDEIHEVLKAQGETLTKIKEMGSIKETFKGAVSKAIKENHKEIVSIYKQGHGEMSFAIKVPAAITTGNATLPAGIDEFYGIQTTPASNVNLRTTFIDNLVTTFGASDRIFTYTDALPKDGDFAFVAEGDAKPQLDLVFETRDERAKKIAAHTLLTEEAVMDIPRLESIVNDYLRKKHDLKRQNQLLFGDGVGENPTGATVYARPFVAGAMATKVATPTIMDVINAVITDIYNTHNFVDEMSYVANLVVINPIDFYLNFVAPKDNDNKPLFPTASLFNTVNLGGVTIIPERSMPSGKLFVCDMSKYNVTNYLPYSVRVGWINDDFTKNQFRIVGESRLHAFVKELDKQAFVYDDIATIEAAILKP